MTYVITQFAIGFGYSLVFLLVLLLVYVWSTKIIR